MTNRHSSLFDLMIFCALLGSTFVAIKIMVESHSPLFVTTIRIFLAAITLTLFVFFTKISFPSNRNTWLRIAAASFLGNILPFLSITFAETEIKSGTASILMGTAPLMAIVFAHVVTVDDKMNRYKVAGTLLGCLSFLFAISVDQPVANAFSISIHHLAVIFAAACMVSSSLVLRGISEPIQPVICAWITLVFASIFVAPSLYFETPDLESLLNINFLISALILGVAGTALAQLFRIRVIQKSGTTYLGYSGYIVPFFGIFFSFIILNERLYNAQILALFGVLIGGYVSRIRA